ncbi:PAS domain-containing protein [Roseibium salinum]|nr:PAS domain-containing protein [Roseibium salinum]
MVPDTVTNERRRGGDDELIRILEQELQTTKERLQGTLEELETSNEELRASNEELSSVNEELQSSNEELETSKEELQSINEELRTVNSELGTRVDELSSANSDLKNLFSNTRIAMLFLDKDFRIRNFTPPAKPLFRLRDHDVGRPLDELAGRIDFEFLRTEVAQVIGTGDQIEHEVEATNGERQTLIMRMLPYRDEQDHIRGSRSDFRRHHRAQADRGRTCLHGFRTQSPCEEFARQRAGNRAPDCGSCLHKAGIARDTDGKASGDVDDTRDTVKRRVERGRLRGTGKRGAGAVRRTDFNPTEA